MLDVMHVQQPRGTMVYAYLNGGVPVVPGRHQRLVPLRFLTVGTLTPPSAPRGPRCTEGPQ